MLQTYVEVERRIEADYKGPTPRYSVAVPRTPLPPGRYFFKIYLKFLHTKKLKSSNDVIEHVFYTFAIMFPDTRSLADVQRLHSVSGYPEHPSRLFRENTIRIPRDDSGPRWAQSLSRLSAFSGYAANPSQTRTFLGSSPLPRRSPCPGRVGLRRGG